MSGYSNTSMFALVIAGLIVVTQSVNIFELPKNKFVGNTKLYEDIKSRKNASWKAYEPQNHPFRDLSDQ
jgi:hypothetical protein